VVLIGLPQVRSPSVDRLVTTPAVRPEALIGSEEISHCPPGDPARQRQIVIVQPSSTGHESITLDPDTDGAGLGPATTVQAGHLHVSLSDRSAEKIFREEPLISVEAVTILHRQVSSTAGTDLMPKVTRIRRIVTLLAAMGIVAGVVATASSQAGADSTSASSVSSAANFFPNTRQEVAFHDQMRKLWEDHVTWTRLTIVSAVGGTDGQALADTGPTLDRLQQNQADIGAAIVPFFGQAAGDQLAALLHEHISGAVTLVLAAKAGDTAGVAAAKSAWYANGQQIADFLAAANPRYWPQDTMREAMQTHLDQTLQEAVDRLHGDYAAEIDDYEHAHLHILEMADLLSFGIIRKFPDQFDQ